MHGVAVNSFWER